MTLGKIFALIVLYGTWQGGAAINTDLKFSTRAACDAAARSVSAAKFREGGATAICVEGD